MSQSRFGSVFTAVAIATTAPFFPLKLTDSGQQTSRFWNSNERSYESGPIMIFFPHSTGEYVRASHDSTEIDPASIEMQLRYQAIRRSFMRYSQGFPANKMDSFSYLANILCKLTFTDNVSSYNINDECIDVVLKLSNGLTLSISSFIDESDDAPKVFSLHRDHSLLISDELPVNEIVNTINSVTV
jgi:hypothetical protein